jgi:hypothetical protein
MTKKDLVVHVRMKDLLRVKDIEVRSGDDLGLFCFRRTENPDVMISNDAIGDMRRDLTRAKESSGFFLGHFLEPEKHDRVLFIEYRPSTSIRRRTRVMVDHNPHKLRAEMRGFVEDGIDCIIDTHCHPWPDAIVSLPKLASGISDGAILKTGAFDRLEESVGFSKRDWKFDKRYSKKASKFGFKRYYFGVFATLHLRYEGPLVGILMLHNGNGMDNVPIGTCDSV